MRFNLSASVKHVAQLLNPDLEIPMGVPPVPSQSSSSASSSSSSSSPPPPPSSSSCSSAPPSAPQACSRANTSSLRSSLSLRRKRRKPVSSRMPPSASTKTEEYTALPSLQRDYAASAAQDPTLRFYSTVQAPAASQSARAASRRTYSKTSAAHTRSSWNGFQSTLDPATTAEVCSPAHDAAAAAAAAAAKPTPYFPLAGIARDGYSTDREATATCFCGAVQLAFPVDGPGLVSSFICHCADCRKMTTSMFASNFSVKNESLKHLRGQANLSKYAQATTVASGHTMTNYFCSTCGSTMYRVGAAFPGCAVLRLGTVDDFRLAETKLRPASEIFVSDRVGWFAGVPGHEVKRMQGMF